MTALLNWYDGVARDLPWRRTRDPYVLWVSEIMLQQTRVETVIPYFGRFLDQFPTVSALAAAPLEQVLKAWEGLGYYNRARSLHKSAHIILERHHGSLPDTPKALQELPGVGVSTSHAILSIAHDLPYPVLDGNVQRVLARMHGIWDDLRRSQPLQRLWDIAYELIGQSPRPGDHNQAMMELGATVCTPRNPRCDVCPFNEECVAFKAGQTELIPFKAPGKRVPHHHVAVGVVRDGERILVQQRGPEGFLAGLWEFPGGKLKEGETPLQAVIRELKEECGVEVEVQSALRTVQHAYSHFRVTLHPFLCRIVRGEVTGCEGQAVLWGDSNDVQRLAFPRGTQQILELLGLRTTDTTGET